jgi:hypothetical protein
MMRTVAVMASLVLTAGGWLLHTANTPFVGARTMPEDLPAVDQGIPLTRIDLPTEAPIATSEEAEVVASWWSRQPQELVAVARSLLSASVTAEDGTTLYAYGCADGAQVVLVTNHQGLVGRCEFDATGTLRLCDDRPSDTLPIVVPHHGGAQRRTSPEDAQQLAVHLLRLRDSSPMFWFEEALAESAEAQWESDCDGWLRTVKTISSAGNSGTTGTFKLDVNGVVQEARTFHWRRIGPCYARAKKNTPPASPDQPDEPVPTLPVANN